MIGATVLQTAGFRALCPAGRRRAAGVRGVMFGALTKALSRGFRMAMAAPSDRSVPGWPSDPEDPPGWLRPGGQGVAAGRALDILHRPSSASTCVHSDIPGGVAIHTYIKPRGVRCGTPVPPADLYTKLAKVI